MIEAMAAAAVPLILAGIGALVSERAGVLNISLEGCISSGAFTAAAVLATGGSPAAAAGGALISGIFFGFLLSAVHIGAGANLFVAGLGINLLIPSLSDLISQVVWRHKGTIRIPEGMLSGFNSYGIEIITWLMIPLIAGTALILKRTEFGRRIRTAGSSPEFLRERGISPGWIRTAALVISSSLASLSGGFLAFRIGGFVPGMSSGRGWIALVIVWMGFRRPAGILVAAYFFSLIEIIAGKAQGLSNVPATLLLALPYAAALVALTLTAPAFFRKRK
jgi:simple sugar transport system permease protein